MQACSHAGDYWNILERLAEGTMMEVLNGGKGIILTKLSLSDFPSWSANNNRWNFDR